MKGTKNKESTMNDAERRALANMLRKRRLALGLSAHELGRRAGIDNATISLIERCKIAQPRVDTIQALATALSIPVADLYAATNWLPEAAMPSLRPYMRAKYENLPEEALAEVEKFIDQLSRQHQGGPRRGEDE